jgi:hypothetical protein
VVYKSQTSEAQHRMLDNAWFKGDCRYGRQLGLELLAATEWTTVDRCIRHGKVGICEWNGQTREMQRRTLEKRKGIGSKVSVATGGS